MLDYVTNILAFPFADIASIAILCLGALELISYLFFSRSSSRVKKQIIDSIKFKNPLDSISRLLWIALFTLSILYSHNTSPISSTLLGSGIALFLIGWSIRYPPYLMERTLRRQRRLRGFLRSYNTLWNTLRLYINNPDLYGPWLEIVGITIIAKSSIVYFPAVFIFPIILGTSAIYKYRKLAKINPHTDFPSIKDLIPKVGNILSIIIIPLVSAIMVGIITREFPIFYANAETAKSILFTLSQIEGGMGILAITIIFVLTQLTASNYSIRISTILFRQSAFWIPLMILFASITYNLTIASRSPIVFPSPTDNFDSLIIDLSFVLGLATASSIAYFIFKAPKMVSPESIITDSLKSVNEAWLGKVKSDWCHPAFQVRLNISYDPFIIIERILLKAVESGDNLTFLSGLVLIRDHMRSAKTIDPRKFPDYLIEIDAYLRHHFRSLVRTAASNSDAYTLLQLIHLIGELGDPSQDSITKCDTYSFDFDEAPGELLLREIIQQSITHKLVECVRRGISIVESRATNVIKTLPEQKDTWLYNSNNHLNTELPEGEKKRLWANDHRIEHFERQYFSYLERIGIQAVELRSTEVLGSVYLSLDQIIFSVVREIQGHSMKGMMVQKAFWSLSEISKAVFQNKLPNATTLTMLEYVAENIDEEYDEPVAWVLVRYVSEVVIGSAKLGLLDFGNVIDSAMIGLRIVEKYTKPAIHLIEAMGESARLVKNNVAYSENKDLQFLYRELVQRIRQVGQAGPRKDPEQIRATTKSVLDSLGEPEFEERKE